MFFSSCSRKHKGISLLDGKKAMLVTQNGGRRPQRSETRSGTCRREPSAGRSQTRGAIKGFLSDKEISTLRFRLKGYSGRFVKNGLRQARVKAGKRNPLGYLVI